MESTPEKNNAAPRDAFKRRIDYLRISVTDRCNLRCLYCAPRDGRAKYHSPAEMLTAAEITRFVRIAHAHGLRKVRITGGEPLLRNDITTLVSSIKAVGVRDLSLTTNGIFLAAMAEALKRAGLDRVNISLDTMEADRFRALTSGGDIHSVWESLARAEKAGLSPVKINMVPMRGINDDEVAAFAALTLKKDYHIRFIELMPVGDHGDLAGKAYLPTGETMKRVSVLGRLLSLPFRGKGPSRNFRIQGAKGVIGFISPMSDHFCRWCNRLRLTSLGRIRPCLFSATEIDIKTPMRAGASDEELGRLFLSAVMAKPEGHSLAGEKPFISADSMSQIGG
jgi:cyclic pyranopterin phosphate synthase